MTVLLVDDNPADADLVRTALAADIDGEIIWVETFADALAELETRSVSCVVFNLGHAGRDHLEQIDILTETNPDVPIVVLTEGDDTDLALEALRHRAQDCLSISELATRPGKRPCPDSSGSACR